MNKKNDFDEFEKISIKDDEITDETLFKKVLNRQPTSSNNQDLENVFENKDNLKIQNSNHVLVNEKGESQLINNRNRSSSLFNGAMKINENFLNCNLDYDKTNNHRRNTSYTINIDNDENLSNENNPFLHQKIKKPKQSNGNHFNQKSNQSNKNLDYSQTESSSTGFFNSLWNSLLKKLNPTKLINTFYSKSSTSLNLSPVHQVNDHEKPNILKNVHNKKTCNCKCNCKQKQSNQELIEINDCLQTKNEVSNTMDLSYSINNLDPFPFKESPVKSKMDTEEWRRVGKEMVDYIAYYKETLNEKRVTPNVEPGYLKCLLPNEAPDKPEQWKKIMLDFEKHILPGITHWQHPHFHAYFPAGNSYPSILADMLSDALGCICFSWAASPACSELETIVLNWVGKMMNLPNEFLYDSKKSLGGGVIQGSASDCVLISLLAARSAALKELSQKEPLDKEGSLLPKLIAYCSKEAHSCVEKSAKIALVTLRSLETDDNFSLRGKTLQSAIEEDIKKGFVPFFVSATLGTTSCCSFDNLQEIGPICEKNKIWLHVDGAYAGNSFICPEFQYLMKGIEYASSFNMNPNKWMLVNFDCSLLWVKDHFKLTEALVVDPLYLQHNYSEHTFDFRNWSIPLSRRFRSLKIWFVIRSYGVEGLRNYIREHCHLAKMFEKLLSNDKRFKVVNQVVLGLVCFKLNGSNLINKKLLSNINASGKLHMVPASLNDNFVIRFCVCAENANQSHIEYAYRVIVKSAKELYKILEIEAQEKLSLSMKHKQPINAIESIPNEISQNAVKMIDEIQDEQIENKESTSEIKTSENKEEEDSVVDVAFIDRRNKKSVKYRRSVFVRMVSDTKFYNNKVNKVCRTYSTSSNPLEH